MILSLAALLALAGRCAPEVAPETLLSVAAAESGFDPLAIAVNTSPRRTYHPGSTAAARALAVRLVGQGLSVDFGLGQINSANLLRLGLSPAEALDPCRNLRASAKILREGFFSAADRDPQAALATAFSLYNTGDPARGRRNGYVARVVRAAARVVPAIQLAQGAKPAPDSAPSGALAAEAPSDWTAPPPPHAVF